MRSKKAKTRLVEKDSVYQSLQVTKLINSVMKSGKKTIAQKHVYKALEIVKEKSKKDPLEILETSLKNISPQMEVRSRRVGGAAYQVPMPVRTKRAQALAIRWLVQEANKRPNKEFNTFTKKLAAEILDSSTNQGGAIQKKLTSHKMAEANKAFSHFRW